MTVKFYETSLFGESEGYEIDYATFEKFEKSFLIKKVKRGANRLDLVDRYTNEVICWAIRSSEREEARHNEYCEKRYA